ncbi:MAG TPA: cytochrome c family protein [Sphingobium sp.]|uniref:c-type cytochrome n=1 Tax=Sphingobium sp. TaxID=1912891 RepID=UPI002ED33DEF
MAGISVVAAIAIIWIGSWFAHRLVRDGHPGALAYKPADMPPPVDLASIQRGWPDSLEEPAERGRLVAYLHDPARQASAVKPAAATAPAAPVDLGALLLKADANAGKAKAAVCMTCHDLTQGGPNRIGPNLWGVIGRGVGSHPGFSYSPAMAAQHGNWTYDRIFIFLASPARVVPGTKMGFPGFSRPEDRAAVIKYLVTLGNNPPPLPPPS